MGFATALRDEDKKVYWKLSIEYHPDKNPEEEPKRKFADIRDANGTLDDPDKKILYDVGAMEGVANHETGQVQKGGNDVAQMGVRLEDLYSGGLQKAGLQRRVVCRGCRAKLDSFKCRGCFRCPSEVKNVHLQTGLGTFKLQQQEAPSKESARVRTRRLMTRYEKGMKQNEKLNFPRMAEERPGMLPGSAIRTLQLQEYHMFAHMGDDLHLAMQMSLREALLRWARAIRRVDGNIVEEFFQGSTRCFQVLKDRGERMPLCDDPASFGDLLVKVVALFPKHLSSSWLAKAGSDLENDARKSEL